MTKYLILLICANVVAYMTNCSQLIWEDAKNYKTVLAVVAGTIITYLYMTATQVGYEAVNKLWTLKVIGFATSTTVFTILTWLLLGEVPTWRHYTSLALAAGIIALHIT